MIFQDSSTTRTRRHTRIATRFLAMAMLSAFAASGLVAGAVADEMTLQGKVATALDAHPEIPVLTVQEHVGDFAGEAVTALPISGEALTEATTETLDAVGDLGDLGFELPAFYVIGQIGREAEAIQAGRSTVGESAIRVAGRTAAVATGAKVGAAIGGLLLPWGGAWLGSIAGGLLARHWLADEPRPAPAPPPRKGRSKYEAGCAPEIDELARRLKAWVEAAAAAAEHEGHEARRQSRALARPASWRDRILPRRSVLIAEEGRRRLSAESAVFTDVADRLRSRSTLAWQGLLRTWSGGLPWLPGLAAEDEAVEAQLKRLRDLAKQHRQRDDRWQTQRGPRPAAVVEVPPPSFTTDWGRWAGVSVIAVVTAVATAFAAGGPTGLATELPAPTLSAVTAPRAPLTPPVVRVGDQGCRLRTAPSLKAPRLAALPPGSTCVVADRARPWIEVRCDERSGFLHEACLAPEQR